MSNCVDISPQHFVSCWLKYHEPQQGWSGQQKYQVCGKTSTKINRTEWITYAENSSQDSLSAWKLDTKRCQFVPFSDDQGTSKTPTQSKQKQSDNDNRSHESEAVMRLRQVFMWRHINSDSSRLLFGLSCDGGTKLWPVLHWLRHYWAISVRGRVMPRHLTLGCFDVLQHLGWSALKTSCLHTISLSQMVVCVVMLMCVCYWTCQTW